MAPPAYKCAACKSLRKVCPPDCIYAPHFPNNNPRRFDCVHRIYGNNTVGKMLQQTPPHLRGELVNALHYEAQCRIEDPIYGSAGVVSRLQQQIEDNEIALANLQAEIALLKLQISQYEAALNLQLMPAQNQGIEQYQWPNQALNAYGQNMAALQMPAQGIEPVQWPNQASIVQSQDMEQFYWLNHAPQFPQMPDQGMELFQFVNQAPQIINEDINMEQPQWPDNNQVLLEQDLEQYQWHNQAPIMSAQDMEHFQLHNQAQVTLAQNTGMEHFQWYNQAP